MELQPIGFVAGASLTIGLILAGLFVVLGFLTTRDTHSARPGVIMIGFGLILAMVTLAIALLVPEQLILAVLFVFFGISGIMGAFGSMVPPPPTNSRSRGSYYLFKAIGGDDGIRVGYFIAGVIILSCGLLGLLTYFTQGGP